MEERRGSLDTKDNAHAFHRAALRLKVEPIELKRDPLSGRNYEMLREVITTVPTKGYRATKRHNKLKRLIIPKATGRRYCLYRSIVLLAPDCTLSAAF